MREPRSRATGTVSLTFVGAIARACAASIALIATVDDRGVHGPREADASVAIAATLEDLARASTVIARVTPLDRTSAWEGGRIVTTTRVRVDEIVAGSTGADPRRTRQLHVRTLGGRVGDIGQLVEGEAAFASSEPSIVFLAALPPLPGPPGSLAEPAYVVAGRAQGQLLVKRDVQGREIVRVGAVGELVERRVRPPLRSGGQRVTELDGTLVSSIGTAIAHAWEAGHAK